MTAFPTAPPVMGSAYGDGMTRPRGASISDQDSADADQRVVLQS